MICAPNWKFLRKDAERRTHPRTETPAGFSFRSIWVDIPGLMSKPTESRESCSRLSPYLAWGHLSMREVVQAAQKKRNEGKNKTALRSFLSRCHWNAHFVQKFESEDQMEFEDINRGFSKIERPERPELVEAWKKGATGFPLVDASMRCLKETGYLNFRMRAMLVSFLTHQLWQPWQACRPHGPSFSRLRTRHSLPAVSDAGGRDGDQRHSDLQSGKTGTRPRPKKPYSSEMGTRIGGLVRAHHSPSLAAYGDGICFLQLCPGNKLPPSRC